MAIAWTYVVHYNYGKSRDYRPEPLHLVRMPNGSGKLFKSGELKRFLTGKKWRKAK